MTVLFALFRDVELSFFVAGKPGRSDRGSYLPVTTNAADAAAADAGDAPQACPAKPKHDPMAHPDLFMPFARPHRLRSALKRAQRMGACPAAPTVDSDPSPPCATHQAQSCC